MKRSACIMTEEKAMNGNGSQGSRPGSTPPHPPPTSDAADPLSDSLALPGPSSRKMFPLFDVKARNNGKATGHTGNSDMGESTTLSEGSQMAVKPKKTSKAAASKGKARSNGVSNSQSSDASASTKERTLKPSKLSKDKTVKTVKATSKSKRKSKNPRLSIDLDDPDIAISTVASSSTFSSTPPPEPHKTVITIADSPVRESKTTKTFADFDGERLAKKAAKEAMGGNGGREPLWPSVSNIHVLPDMQNLGKQGRPSCAKRDWKGKGRAVELELDDKPNRIPMLSSDAYRSVIQQFITFDGRTDSAHNGRNGVELGEAIRTRLEAATMAETSDHAQQCWYTRYAPTKATDVLGERNGENAMYLRDWLKELTLQDPLAILRNSRKRKVKREVTVDERKKIRKAAKKRKRKGYDGLGDEHLQDFIASDDEEEYDYYDYYGLPDDASVPSPTKSTSSHGSHRRGRFEPLTNVILLAGPVASGKTSTVYAIANELQWQVFEVYPGIGKRGYKDLDRYVGMVGENHIMNREAPPVSSFFGKGTSKSSTFVTNTLPVSSENGSNESQPLAVSSSDSLLPPSAIAQNKVKQSCILIEEVDVLFGSDSGFWEGLVSFISRSRRPVILTCNDVTSIPKDSLPFQNILYFQSTEPEMVKCLLKEIAAHEGKQVGNHLLDDILKVQATAKHGDLDIRQAINQLQFVTSNDCPATTAFPHVDFARPMKHALREIQTVLENASFVDAELRRRSWMAWEDEERVAQPEKEDDEFLYPPDLPVHGLDLPPEPDPNQPLPMLAREEEFCEALGIPEDNDEHSEAVYKRQCKLCSDLQTVAETHLDDSKLHPLSSVLHSEVIPFLREIVHGDDMQEQAFNIAMEIQADDIVLDARVRRSRRLVGFGKEGYRRHLDMSADIANDLRRSELLVQADNNLIGGGVGGDSVHAAKSPNGAVM